MLVIFFFLSKKTIIPSLKVVNCISLYGRYGPFSVRKGNCSSIEREFGLKIDVWCAGLSPDTLLNANLTKIIQKVVEN